MQLGPLENNLFLLKGRELFAGTKGGGGRIAAEGTDVGVNQAIERIFLISKSLVEKRRGKGDRVGEGGAASKKEKPKKVSGGSPR